MATPPSDWLGGRCGGGGAVGWPTVVSKVARSIDDAVLLAIPGRAGALNAALPAPLSLAESKSERERRSSFVDCLG